MCILLTLCNLSFLLLRVLLTNARQGSTILVKRRNLYIITYFSFREPVAVIRGRSFDSEGRGRGLARFGNKYFDLENAENKLSIFFWIENK